MSRRKIRPAFGTPVSADMSARDLAAALGLSTAEISRWKRLSEVPKEDFEAALASYNPRKQPRLSAQRIIDLSRGWDRSAVRRAKCCPHCGKSIEAAR